MSAPRQRAIDAATDTIAAWYGHRPAELARAVIDAAWPHLVGHALEENAALRAIANERWAQAAEWEDIAGDLAAALRKAHQCNGNYRAGDDRGRAALARYNQASS